MIFPRTMLVHLFPLALLKLGHSSSGDSSGGTSTALQTVNGLFALTFILTRVGLYGAGVIHLVVRRDVLWTLAEKSGAPPVFVVLTLACVALGGVLNLVWLRSIVKMAFPPAARKEREEKHD